MAPHKRKNADNASAISCKRQKSSKAAKKSSAAVSSPTISTSSNDMYVLLSAQNMCILTSSRTAQNSASSPLLRLPAELRNQIWADAYGNNTIHVYNRNITFYGVRSGPLVLLYCVRGKNQRGACECIEDDAAVRAFLPLVSKQFWFEASGVFLSSNIFHFQEAQPFRALALEHAKFAGRATDIRITFPDLWDSTIRHWDSALTSSILGRFKGIHGIALEFHLGDRELHMLQRKDVMRDAVWKEKKITAFIRAFQQHQLQESHTSITFLARGYHYRPASNPGRRAVRISLPIDAQGMDSVIKDLLLDYHPRRLSKRGQQEE
jgi:hypothetical protein